MGEPDTDASWTMAAASAPKGIGEQRLLHELAVAAEMQKWAKLGFIVTPSVAFIVQGVLAVVDIAVSRPGVSWMGLPWPIPAFLIEVKTGQGPLTKNQQFVYPRLRAGTLAMPYGANAYVAGFEVGVDVWIQMSPQTVRYPGICDAGSC